VSSSVPVLWVIKGLGPGGAEHLLVDLARHADRERFRYRCVYLMPSKDHLVAALREEGVVVSGLGMRSDADPRWVLRLRELVSRSRPAIVHAHLPYAAIGSRLAVRSLGKRSPRMISTEHNTAGRYRAPTRWADRATLPLDDRTIAVSRSVAASFPSRRRIDVIPNGVDVERLRSRALDRNAARDALGLSPDAAVVGTVGGITAKKGHGALLEAARRVVAKDSDATFVWIGLPIEGAPLERRIAEASLTDRVRLAGYRENAAELLRAFDVFCLPSLHEGLPLSVLEALAVGVPVVATSVGGVPEALAGGGGLLVPPGDAEALATALLELLEDPGRRARLSAEGSTAAKAFDVRETARRTEALYLDTVGAGG
jgi:glycosyltransferase involved in cell wall biosynthesis